jgi:hypothetical protein
LRPFRYQRGEEPPSHALLRPRDIQRWKPDITRDVLRKWRSAGTIKGIRSSPNSHPLYFAREIKKVLGKPEEPPHPSVPERAPLAPLLRLRDVKAHTGFTRDVRLVGNNARRVVRLMNGHEIRHRRRRSSPMRERERTNAEVNLLRRVPNFGGRKELRNASTNDLRNALALLKYVHTCQRAALVAPGVVSALQSTPDVGVHCYDRAYRFVDEYLYEAECWFEKRIEELERAVILREQGEDIL